MDKLSHVDAMAFVEEIYAKNGRRWEQRVNNGPFTRQLAEGSLPLSW